MAEQPAEEDSASEDLPVAEQHTTADYEKFAQPEKPIRNWTKIFSIFIIIVLLLAAGAGAAWYFTNHKSAKPQPTPAAQTAPTNTEVATKSYTSPNLYLTFAYPSNWTIVDSGGGIMTVTSPEMQIKNAAGQEVAGKITMTIRTSVTSLPGFTKGNGTAVMDSQKITYTHPTQTQRANTYVTFVAYSTTTTANSLDAIYITGDNGYTKGQAVPQSDLTQVSPIIGLTFTDKNGKTTTIAASNWDNSDFSGPILAMLESLSIT